MRNIALRNILRRGRKLSSEVLFLLEETKNEKNAEKIQEAVKLVQEKIQMVMGSLSDPYSELTKLTPMEMRIALMIKNGYKNKDIAKVQNMSLNTVKTHRKNIRKKLNLTHKKINLASFFKSTLTTSEEESLEATQNVTGNDRKDKRISDPYVDRRSGEDRRQVYDADYFINDGLERRSGKERRLQKERRKNFIRVSRWSSICKFVQYKYT